MVVSPEYEPEPQSPLGVFGKYKLIYSPRSVLFGKYKLISLLGRGGMGEWFVRMEYVEGAALSEVLKRAARMGEHLPLEAVLSIGAGLASALDYAHHAIDSDGRQLGIVHRDVTPHNVLLRRSGEVKLIDFGVARAEQRFLRTSPGLVKGKLPYMSPEQADGQAHRRAHRRLRARCLSLGIAHRLPALPRADAGRDDAEDLRLPGLSALALPRRAAWRT